MKCPLVPIPEQQTFPDESCVKAPMRQRSNVVRLVAGLLLFRGTPSAHAQSALAGDPIHISRAHASIAVDSDLSDEGWRGATRIDKWYEVNPGDNTEPKFFIKLCYAFQR
jgi:hypothetical protein